MALSTASMYNEVVLGTVAIAIIDFGVVVKRALSLERGCFT